MNRFPMVSMIELLHHTNAVITMAWDPKLPNLICTGSSDLQIILWNSFSVSPEIKNGYVLVPIFSYPLPIETMELHWSTVYPDLMGICQSQSIYLLRCFNYSCA